MFTAAICHLRPGLHAFQSCLPYIGRIDPRIFVATSVGRWYSQRIGGQIVRTNAAAPFRLKVLVGTDMPHSSFAPGRRFYFRLLTISLCGAIWAGACLRSRADFDGAQPITTYPFVPGDGPTSFVPLDAKDIPGAPGLMGLAGKYGGVHILDFNKPINMNRGGNPILQLPLDFHPLINDGGEVPGVYISHNESGLLGVAFHPDFAVNRKFYVHYTIDNMVDPDGAFIPGVSSAGGVDDDELKLMDESTVPPGNPNYDPANPTERWLDKCYRCEAGAPRAVRVGSVDYEIRCPVLVNGQEKPAIAQEPVYTEIREYTVNDHGQPDNPAVWDSSFSKTILRFKREREFHNGGWIDFGPDGMLYLSSGDSQGRPLEKLTVPQDPAADFFGKILRVDVNGDDFSDMDDAEFDGHIVRNYAIPPDNPFASNGMAADDEVYVYGLRHPWRSDFDNVTADLWIGDTGNATEEEVDLSPASSGGGEYFGWPYLEGATPTEINFPPWNNNPPPAPAVGTPVPPEHRYQHHVPPGAGRASIIGGVMYRGPDPTLQGLYIFFDSNRRQIWSYDPDEPNPALKARDISHKIFDDNVAPFGEGNADKNGSGVPMINNNPVGTIATIGEDAAGNLYLVEVFGGDIHKVNTSFLNPMDIPAGSPGTMGDFNSDGNVDAKDIDLLALAAINDPTNPLYDLNGPLYGGTDTNGVTFSASDDGLIISDSDVLVRQLVDVFDSNGVKIGNGTEYGDLRGGGLDGSKLDGSVSLIDLDKLVSNYRDPGLFGWADGNINGSLQTGTSTDPRITLIDLDTLVGHYGFGTGNGAAFEAVPEPGSWMLSLLAAFAIVSTAGALRPLRR
jgi:hypothetical protein